MNISKAGVAGTAAVAAIAALIAGAGPAFAGRQQPAHPAWSAPAVYQGKITGVDIVLGPQSDPTLLVRTPPLPAGRYLVTYAVSAVIASHDQIVCAASNVPAGNDGVFGTAGNPGTGGIYGTAASTDTITVRAGQRISVTCNAFNYGKGTWAGNAVLEAVPVARVN
jgi:hypothetical protein